MEETFQKKAAVGKFEVHLFADRRVAFGRFEVRTQDANGHFTTIGKFKSLSEAFEEARWCHQNPEEFKIRRLQRTLEVARF